MAVAHRVSLAGPTGNPTTGGTLLIDAACAANDLLFLSVTSRDATGTAPTVTDNDTGGNAWTKIGNDTNNKGTLWWKRATSGTAGKTITIAGCVGSCSAVLSIYSGADTGATPYANISVEDNISGNETHAGFTPAVADSMICLSVFNVGNDNAVTTPACTNPGALNTRGEKLSTGGSDCACIHASALQSGGPTATGNFTWAQVDGVTVSIVFSIKPLAGVNYTETGLGQTLLFSQALVGSLAASELSRSQTVLFSQTQSDLAAFSELGRSQTVLLTQGETESYTEDAGPKGVFFPVSRRRPFIGLLRTKLSVFVGNNYNETELSQSILFATNSTDTAAFVDTDKSQVILFTQAVVDSAVLLDTAKAQTILFAQNITDAISGQETGRSQIILFGQVVSGNLSGTETRAETILFSQAVSDIRSGIEGVGQTILFSQNRTDVKSGIESVGQTVLFTQNKSDVLAAVDTGKSQIILFTQAGTDEFPGNYQELNRSQTILFSQARTDSLSSAETGLGMSFLLQGSLQNQIWTGVENIGQTTRFTQASTDTGNFNNIVGQTILFITGGTDSMPPKFGTFIAVAKVKGRLPERSGVIIRGGI